MPGALSSQQIGFLVLLLATFALLLSERVRKDIIALFIILVLYFSGMLSSEEALSGFGSEPAIVVAAIFVLTGALHLTGFSEIVGARLGRIAGSSYNRVIVVVMPAVALLSAFTHHVTTTAIMIPVMLNLARERQMPASKLLMPISFAASLGTTITIIGAPAFLIASSVLQQGGRPGLGVFDIAPIGLVLSLVGTLFMLTAGRWLLPSRAGGEDSAELFRLDKYFTEIVVLPNSTLVGKTLQEVKAGGQYHFTVAGWVRDRQRLPGPFHEQTLEAGDVLLVQTTPEDIVAFRNESNVELHPVEQYATAKEKQVEGAAASEGTSEFAQAIIAVDSDLIGRTLSEIDFRRRFGPVVIGLWRRTGWLRTELAKIRLREGDALLLMGDADALARVAANRNFLMLVPFRGELRLRRKARLAGLIMLATMLIASLGVVSLAMASLVGAVLAVLSRCITARQGYRAIDVQIYVFIAGAIPLGAAMTKTGTADWLAHWLQALVRGWNEGLVLLAIFAVVSVLTQLMSDSATTALFAPVAFALAQALGQPPEPYVVTVAMASVAAFLTPMGHHGNLLIYQPGRYEFADFVKVGTPLTVLVGIVVALLAPVLWSH